MPDQVHSASSSKEKLPVLWVTTCSTRLIKLGYCMLFIMVSENLYFLLGFLEKTFLTEALVNQQHFPELFLLQTPF